MRTNKLVRHGHLIVSHYEDSEGVEQHNIFDAASDSPWKELCRKAKDAEINVQMQKHGDNPAYWAIVTECSTLAQALKIAKTRRMFSELSTEEQQEILRAVYPIVETSCSEDE